MLLRKMFIYLFFLSVISILCQEGRKTSDVRSNLFNVGNEKKEERWEDSCSAKWLESINAFTTIEKMEFEKIMILPESFLDLEPAGIFQYYKDILIAIYSDIEGEYYWDNWGSIVKGNNKEREFIITPSGVQLFVPLALLQVYIDEEQIDKWNFTIAHPHFEVDCNKYEISSKYANFVKSKGIRRKIKLERYVGDLKEGEILIEKEKTSNALGIISKKKCVFRNEKKCTSEEKEVIVRCIFLCHIPKECQGKDLVRELKWSFTEFMKYIDIYLQDMKLFEKENKKEKNKN